eukprot:Pgem_evm1s8891
MPDESSELQSQITRSVRENLVAKSANLSTGSYWLMNCFYIVSCLSKEQHAVQFATEDFKEELENILIFCFR